MLSDPDVEKDNKFPHAEIWQKGNSRKSAGYKLNKYYKKFTIMIIAYGFGCISRSIAVNSSLLGQNSQPSLDKTGFEHRRVHF